METSPWIIFALVFLRLNITYAVEFDWSTSQVGECLANDTSFGLCAKSVRVECVKKIDGQPVPERYCRELSGSKKPPTLVPCDLKECRQRCVVSMWSTWNPCDPTCVLPFQYRTRSVLWRDEKTSGAVCPTLIERSQCARCAKSSRKDTSRFFWKVGEWGTCRQFTTITVHQFSDKTRDDAASPRHAFCGAVLTLGKSTRIVRCVDGRGEKVKWRNCLNSKDKYGRMTQQPEKSKVCGFPCDCRLSDWSQWSGCSTDCHVNKEKRTRDVLYAAQLGGKACGALEEIRACDSKTCPRYEWDAAAWGLCQTQRFPGNSDVSKCGHGFQERLVFCVELSSNKSIGELQPVQDDRCDPRMKLTSRKACLTPCLQDCKVSDWQPWQPCPVKCGKAGIKRRTRIVLQTARHDGKDCPHLVELLPCDRVQCISWRVSPWSTCFTTRCGPSGIRVRHVYCVTYNQYGRAKECSHLVKPATRASCAKPCPHDCAVSHWSEWGPCSKSCGINGGIQTRHKKIMGYPNAGGVPCPDAKQLVESQKCNQYTYCEEEMTFLWKAEPWDICEPLTKGSCGNITTGVKKRNIHCVTGTQKLGNSSFCPLELKPLDVQPCALPCPKDCIVSKWQEWSVCSKTCSSTEVEIRKRYVLQEASHNGIPCPSNMTDGVETESRPCTVTPPCYRYQWLASKWEKCTLLLPTRSTQTNCGSGYKTRNISCLISDKTVVKPSFCFNGLFTAPPKYLKECWIPCPDSCVRSDWSNWSTCPNSCMTNSPNFRQRTRQVVSLSPGRGGFPTTCPQLTAIDISEREECSAISCFSYKWHTGSWGSCILNDIYCGNGTKQRAVLCKRSDKLFVSETYCSSNATKPSLSQHCSVNCSQDCVVASSWGNWSNCSNNCGDNIQTRHRIIVKSPVGYGKLCPSLTEKRLCHQPPCSLFKWSSDLWNTCKINTNSTCGNGTQMRKVICLPDPTRELICMKQTPKPLTTQPCERPCPGDCVLSNWGSWTICVKGRQGCFQKRRRTIIRQASLTSSRKCDNKKGKSEEKSCDCPATRKLVLSKSKLMLSEWSTCQLNNISGPNCGAGLQFRSVECVGEKSQILPDKYCTGLNTTALSQDCHVKCPVDCVLGEWSPWSVCSKTCGLDGMGMRSRTIIVANENGGRKCPDKSLLKQKRPCNGKPCFTYVLKKGSWSKCYVDGQGCGYGMQTREAWCQRSDRQSVDLYYCFEHLKRSTNDTEDHYLNVLQAVLNNISTMSISTKQKCEVGCPGNCVVSDWSEWSICGSSCFLHTNQSFQTRSRVIISKPVTGRKACSSELQQTRKCQPHDNNCIRAKWNTGPWQKNGTREVWCETSNGLNVSGACVINNKPSMTKLCHPTCQDPNAVCTDGKCICKPLFEFFQYRCIPLKGCLHNGHCVLKNTICKEQKCKCREGHGRNTTTGHCVLSPSTNRVPIIKTNLSDHIEKKAIKETPGTGKWKWIGIGVGAFTFFIIIILLAIGVFCYTRRRNRSKNKHDEKAQNRIELIGMLSITDGDQKSEKA